MTQKEKFNGLLRWRCIGPFRGGRCVTVAGSYHDSNVFYFGAVAGGIWKTDDGGTYWNCISDGFLNTSSIGALAVAPSDSNVIYAGTGETTIRIDVSHGDGVYKSTDGGETWRHIGLEKTRHIAKIRVHPDDPNIVYVAAFGHAFGPNPERGVYKSTDGGETWRRVLHQSDKAGAIDLSIDPNNPRILYAAIWEAYRNFWQISSGGEESSLWKSTDGGETWQELTNNPGLPTGVLGKIGVAASVQPGRVWALIENKDGGLYRSENGGRTWKKVSNDQNLLSRAWYYTHITADPVDGNTVYVNNLSFHKSTDGGQNFEEITTPHGDNHDVWIDPTNNQRMIQANDGGANVSYNGGRTWSTIYNQPTAQFYHLDVDNREPYRVYGTQQDNSSLSVPSRSPHASISWEDIYIAGSGESGFIAVNPDDPDIVFVGAIGSSPGGGNSLQRYNHRTRQIRLVTTWPESMSGHGAEDDRYRFAWTYPIIYSPHDSGTIYIGGNHVFKTTNEGQSWEKISPDLTKADPETLKPSGGPINRDSLGAETYATVYALAESLHEQGVLWAGSDDGLIHISRNGGESWEDITPDLPEWTMISMIEASPHDAATAYVAATRYKNDDYAPYLLKTTDYGQSWQRINDGIEDDHFTRAIREDPNRAGLLYAGTEVGLYVSFDAGDSWERFQLNLPVSPIHDLKVKNEDLVVATHGRSFWILDDLSPLYQYHAGLTDSAFHLFQPRTSERILGEVFDGGFGLSETNKNYMTSLGRVAPYVVEKMIPPTVEEPDETGIIWKKYLDSGENPPRGVIITYFLQEKPGEPLTLTIQNEAGETIRTFKSPKKKEQDKKKIDPEAKKMKAPARAGWNRFVWDFRHEDVTKVKGEDPVAEMTIPGPVVAPGNYSVTLTVGEESATQSFTIVKMAGAEGSDADLQAQYDLLLKIHAKTDEVTKTINQLRDLRTQLKGWKERMSEKPNGEEIQKTAASLHDKLLELEKAFAVPDRRPGWADAFNNGARLLDKITALPEVVGLGDYRPTDQAVEAYDYLAGLIDAELQKLHAVLNDELPLLNSLIAESSYSAIVP